MFEELIFGYKEKYAGVDSTEILLRRDRNNDFNGSSADNAVLNAKHGKHFVPLACRFTDTEPHIHAKIKDIWIKLLDLEGDPTCNGKIEDSINFFDVGGHSLLAARMASTIRSTLGIECPVKLIFEHQTLTSFVDAVLSLNKHKFHANIKNSSSNTRLEHAGAFLASKLQIPMLELLKNAEENQHFSILEAYANTIEVKCHCSDSEKILVAVNKLVQRHAALRTVFFYETQENIDTTTVYFQKIISPSEINLQFCDIARNSHHFSTFGSLQIAVFFNELKDVSSEAMFTLKISHLITDGHSMNVIFKDLFALYTNASLPQLTADYIDFTNSVNNEICHDDILFWKQLLDQPRTTLEHDSESAEISDKTSGICTRIFKNGNKIVANLVKSTQCSPLALFIHSVAFRLRERQLEFEEAIRIAFPKDLRESECHFDVIGLFVNTLIIPVCASDTAVDIEKKLDLMKLHATTTLSDVIKILPSNSAADLFDVMVVCDNSLTSSDARHKDGDNHFQVLDQPQLATKYPLTIFFQTTKNDLKISVVFQKSIYKQSSAESLLNALITDQLFPKTMIALPDKPETLFNTLCDCRDLSLIILEKCDLFSAQIAFRSEIEILTYSDLKKRLLDLSAIIQVLFIQQTGIILNADTVIPVVTKKSINQWLVCLAIILSGAAYLPIDEANPDSRICNIIDQVNSQFVITTRPIGGQNANKCVDFYHLLGAANGDATTASVAASTILEPSKVQGITKNSISSASHANLFFEQPSFNDGEFRAKAASCHLAYVIFTSGTTGVPKGVCINRLGVANMIQDAPNFFEMHPKSVVYQFTNFCFDNSILEVFSALGSGATIFCPNEPFAVDTFCQQIDDYDITHAMLFPGLIETFNDDQLLKLKKLSAWIGGAEKMSSNLFDRVNGIGLRVIQKYGPTETAAYCLRKKMKPLDDPQNLGRPLPNAKVSVRRLDKVECMPGSKGELHVASIGLTRGYISRSNMEQPFVVLEDGLVHYPTGDICQQLFNGEIRFVGRKDNQVKIRGFRVEMDEIESVLMTHPQVTLAKVLLTDDEQDLIVYFTNKLEIEPATTDLRQYLQKKLPHYMIPRWFIYLKTMPLTPNNKIDNKKLKQMQLSAKQTEVSENVMPETHETENPEIFHVLENIWKSILKLSDTHQIHKTDNFFYFGGNSLSANYLINTVNKRTLANVKMVEFYANTTFGGLLETIIASMKVNSNLHSKTDGIIVAAPSIEKIDRPLSFQQEQMLYLHESDPESAYNLIFIQPFNQSFNPELFKKSVRILLQRHTILRTKFVDGNDCEIYQRVIPMDQIKFELNVEPVEIDSEAGLTALKKQINNFKNQKFDLFNDIPVRGTILKCPDGYTVVIVMHHCACDATSTQIIERELGVIYTQLSQSKNAILPAFMNYADYSEIQKSSSSIQNLEQLAAEYIKSSGFLNFPENVVELYHFFKLPDSQAFTQKCTSFTFELVQTKKTEYTTFTLTVAAIMQTFENLTSVLNPEQQSLIIGAPYANRDETTMSTVGNFLNNLVIPIQIHQTNTHEQLRSLQIKLLAIQKYGILPYQLLSNKLKHQFGAAASSIQIYVNCRYELENEASLEHFGDLINVGTTYLDGFARKIIGDNLVNYPIEIDVDETTANGNVRNHTVQIRISKSLIDHSNNVFINAFINELENNFKIFFNSPLVNGTTIFDQGAVY